MQYILVGQNIFGGEALRVLINHGMRPELLITRPPNEYSNLAFDVARGHNIPLMTSTTINRDQKLLDTISSVQPSFILCCGWAHRIREPLLSMPRLGWVNIHPSYLPKYRGPSPIEWQIMLGEKCAGCTAHFMSEKFDEGNIIAQEKVKIEEDDTGETLKWKCGAVMGKLAIDTVTLLAQTPSYAGIRQDSSQATYYPYRPDAMQVDWNDSAHNIRDVVRALSPFPCVIMTIDGHILRIAEVAVTSHPSGSRVAGHIAVSAHGTLEVAARDYVVRIVALRCDGTVTKNYMRYIPEQALARL